MKVEKVEIEFTQTAANQVRTFRKREQRIILDAIEKQLSYEPATETKNRKRLGENEVSDWELRVRNFRVLYDIAIEEKTSFVKIKAVGHKVHNTLYIGGKEIEL